jgi:hypothetical protein
VNRWEMGDGVSRIMEDMVFHVSRNHKGSCYDFAVREYLTETIRYHKYYLLYLPSSTLLRDDGQVKQYYIVKILCPSRVDGRRSTPTADVDDGRRRRAMPMTMPMPMLPIEQ